MMNKLDCEDFGVCTKEDLVQENKSLVLHLRIHSKPVQTVEDETTDATLTQLPQNETYHELMKYNPSIHHVPVAYEKENTDSIPFLLQVEQAVDSKQNQDLASCTADDAPHIAPVDNTNPNVCSTLDTGNKWCCWWCTYAFNHEPYTLPVRVDKQNTYETIGQFCTPECCAAYIFDSKNNYSDPWKQYEMLHRMLINLKENNQVHIKLAPPRETLQRFGGPYSIQEYRKLLSDYRKDVQLCTSPIQPVQRHVEEISVDFTTKKHKFLPIDTTRIKRAENELSLKRKKKQNSENTLETFMRLRITEQN